MVGKALLREDKNFHSDNSSVLISDGRYPADTSTVRGQGQIVQMFECCCFLVIGVVPSASALEFESRF